MERDEMIGRIGESFAVLKSETFRDETTLVVERDAIHAVCRFCKEELGFNYLVDISSVDQMGEDPRFEVVYELFAFYHGAHLRLKISVGEDDPVVRTVSGVWATADWHEREIWDMMGIRFEGHPDLRRILMWDGYPFHPLRKDFPLEGKPSDVPDVAFTKSAPLDGGPFLAPPMEGTVREREPRARG